MEVSERIERIKREQEEMHWSVANLSDASGIHRTTIYRIYTGEVNPDTYTLEHMEDALGISDIPAVEAKIISQRESLAIFGKEKLIDGFVGNKTYSNFAKRAFKELMKEIECPDYTPYDCRHTFTTQAVRTGIDPQTLKRMLGHADLSTTDKYYTHLDLNDILSASKNLL